MNRLDAMGLFLRVAELGSFSAAASQLGLARSVVTRQVASLEEHLGVKLMVRSTRRLSLTSAGSGYLEKCRDILERIEEAEAGVMEGRLAPSGQLRVSLPLSFGLKQLVPMLLEFSQEYPTICMAMDFSDRQLNLIEESIDLSIRITSQVEPGQIVRKLGNSRLLTVAAPSYLAQRGHPDHPKDLTRHNCLGYSPQANNRPWTFLIDGRIESFYQPYCIQANNGDALADAATRGLGISVLPEFIVAEYLATGELTTLLQSFEPPALGVYAVLPSNRYMPQRVRVLIDFLSSRLAN